MDGVLTFRERQFSEIYVKKFQLDPAPITHFFTTEWCDFVTGKKDLKNHIAAHPEIWQWGGTPESLMDYWFKSEDNRNEPLLTVIKQLRSKGIKCYIATEQEKYRTDYLKNTMFAGEFDGCFSTCDIGYKKSNPQYFESVLTKLKQTTPTLTPKDVIYLDDSANKLDAAKLVGIDGELYTGPHQVAHLLD